MNFLETYYISLENYEEELDIVLLKHLRGEDFRIEPKIDGVRFCATYVLGKLTNLDSVSSDRMHRLIDHIDYLPKELKDKTSIKIYGRLTVNLSAFYPYRDAFVSATSMVSALVKSSITPGNDLLKAVVHGVNLPITDNLEEQDEWFKENNFVHAPSRNVNSIDELMAFLEGRDFGLDFGAEGLLVRKEKSITEGFFLQIGSPVQVVTVEWLSYSQTKRLGKCYTKVLARFLPVINFEGVTYDSVSLRSRLFVKNNGIKKKSKLLVRVRSKVCRYIKNYSEDD